MVVNVSDVHAFAAFITLGGRLELKQKFCTTCKTVPLQMFWFLIWHEDDCNIKNKHKKAADSASPLKY